MASAKVDRAPAPGPIRSVTLKLDGFEASGLLHSLERTPPHIFAEVSRFVGLLRAAIMPVSNDTKEG